MPEIDSFLQPSPASNIKANRSVTFQSSVIKVANEDDLDSDVKTLSRSSFQPGRRTGYIRKGPALSDSETDEDDDTEEEKEEDEDEDDDEEEGPEQRNAPPLFSTNAVPKAEIRPGQNYRRKSPLSSDTESEPDVDKEGSATPSHSILFGVRGESHGVRSDIEASDDEEDTAGITRPFSQTRISGPGQNYVRKAPATSDSESDIDDVPLAAGCDLEHDYRITNIAAPTHRLPADRASSIPQTGRPDISPVSVTGGAISASTIQNISYVPGSGLTALNFNNPNTDGSTASVANSLAIYQQQQQEMMMIMQQQQIQIATMQQQQQAYQLLVLQQQQQHQQQLQVMQMQHLRTFNYNSSLSVRGTEDHRSDLEDDDDIPLGVKKQQASPPHDSALSGEQIGVPVSQMLGALPALPALHFTQHPESLPQQPSSYPLAPPYTMPLQYHPTPLMPSLLETQHHHSIIQPTQAESIGDEEQRMSQEHLVDLAGAEKGAKLLTNTFPGGYYNSTGPGTSSQPGSLVPVQSNEIESTEGGMAHKSGSSRNSLVPQTLLQSMASSSGFPMPQSSQQPLHHTLIHVEAKPPPPQTGLVGAITAMEREKMLAKAHGTNQFQLQQHQQQQQQQQLINAEKERWLQDQRRLVWEAEQTSHHHASKTRQHPLHEQQTNPFCLPPIPSIPLWTVQNNDEGNA
ncbi:MAG: hypothetical protein J3Q66DRAFT_373415 [Benniella sp.]|nr:MAG: hypothetical protein J3Q66DRAFT_373415 [Benniella sp.]